MPRVSACASLILAAAAACGGGERSSPPVPRTSAGNPRVAAAFEGLMRASIDGAEEAKVRHAEAVIHARLAEVAAIEPSLDTPIVVDLPAVTPSQVPDVDALTNLLAAGGGGTLAPAVEIRFRRGMSDYPEDLLDAQAEAAQRAVEHCAGDVDRSVSITLRIDARATPPAVHVAGAQGLDGCIERELRVLSDEGVFVAVLRVSP